MISRKMVVYEHTFSLRKHTCLSLLRRGVIVLLNFPYVSPKPTQTGSLGATESEVGKDSFNVKV